MNTNIPMYFPPKAAPIQVYDKNMARLERANPETFRVERRSHFAMVLDAYLSEQRVEQIFEPWPAGRELVMQTQGRLGIVYYAHGDPAKSNELRFLHCPRRDRSRHRVSPRDLRCDSRLATRRLPR